MTNTEKEKEDYVASGILKYPFMDKFNMQKWNFPKVDCPLLSARLVARGSVDHSHMLPTDNEDLLSELPADYEQDRDATYMRLSVRKKKAFC